MSKILVDGLEAIRDHAQHHALFEVRRLAVEALAAYRAAPLAGLNRDTLAEVIYHAGDVNIPWITALRAADAVLRIVDEHTGRTP